MADLRLVNTVYAIEAFFDGRWVTLPKRVTLNKTLAEIRLEEIKYLNPEHRFRITPFYASRSVTNEPK